MNQAEVKCKQIQAIISIIGLITWLVLGKIVGDEGIVYFAVAAECFMFFYFILMGRIPEVLGRLVRSRCAKGQYKNAGMLKLSVMIFQVIIGILSSILLFLLAPILVEKIFGIPYGTLGLRILSIVIVIRVLVHVFLGYFEGSGTQMPTVVVQLLRQVLTLGFAFIFVRKFLEYGEKVKGLLLNDSIPFMYGAAGMAIAVAVTELLLLVFVVFLYLISKRALIKDEEGLKKTETFFGTVGNLYGAMSPWIATNLLVHLPVWLGMIFFFRKAEEKSIALISYGKYYGKYLIICMLVILIAGTLIHSLASRGAKAIRKGEYRYAREIVGTGFHISVVSTIYPVVYLAVLSTQVNHYMEGTKGPAGELAKLFLVGSAFILFAVLAQFMTRCILYIGKRKILFGSLGLYVLSYIITLILYFRISGVDIQGLIYGGIVSTLILCVSSCIYMFRLLHLRMDLIYWLGVPIVASTLAGLVCYLFGRFVTPYMGYAFTVILGFLIGLIVYWVVLLVLRSFSRQELELMPGGRLIKKIIEIIIR